MRLGLLADVHESIELLAAAIDRCRDEGADRLLLLGDVFDHGARFDETVAMLREARIEGVWGNHEFGICHDPDQKILDAFPATTLEYMARLKPRMEVEGALLSHIIPCLDPTDVTQPWYIDGFPVTTEELARNFGAVPQRRIFIGHYHRWRIATPDAVLPWDGSEPYQFDAAQRYLVGVAAVSDGYCAVYDVEADRLTPCDLCTGGMTRGPATH